MFIAVTELVFEVFMYIAAVLGIMWQYEGQFRDPSLISAPAAIVQTVSSETAASGD